MITTSSKKSIFGIDLSELSIKVAQVKKRGSDLVLTSIGKKDIPAGVIGKGEIMREKEAVKIIRESVSGEIGKKINTKYVACSLPEDSAFIKVIRIPEIERDKMGDVVKWQIEPNFPVKLEEVYFDWELVESIVPQKGPKEREGKSKERSVSIAVIPKKIVDSYLSIFRKAGLQPVIFEIESMAAVRSLVKDCLSSHPIIVLDLGQCGTGLTIFSGRTILFTSHINISAEDFDRAIARELKVKTDEAEKLKKEIGLINVRKKWRAYRVPVVEKNSKREISESRLNLLKAVKEDKIFDALIPILTDLSEQVSHLIDYFKDFGKIEHIPDGRVTEVILCGGGGNLIGLCDFLSASLKLPVKLGNPLINISRHTFPEKEKDLLGGNFLTFATAIGLAIRGAEE